MLRKDLSNLMKTEQVDKKGEKMDARKIIATFAVLMLAVAGIMVITPIDDADASGSVGNYNFYYYTSTTEYSVYQSTGYNASDALNSQSILLSAMDSTVDNAYSKEYTNDYGTYTSINDEWGKITKNSASAVDGSVWTVYVYTYDGENNEGRWKVADKTLGFYKPFNDYNSAYATANVALFYGTAGISLTMPTESLQQLTQVTETATYAINFVITYNDGNENLYLTGYGSDAALALIDAVDANNVSLNMVPGVSYGYLNSLYQMATDNSSGTWVWWHMENDSKDDSSMTESLFYLGFYIPMNGFELSCNIISLTYN